MKRKVSMPMHHSQPLQAVVTVCGGVRSLLLRPLSRPALLPRAKIPGSRPSRSENLGPLVNSQQETCMKIHTQSLSRFRDTRLSSRLSLTSHLDCRCAPGSNSSIGLPITMRASGIWKVFGGRADLVVRSVAWSMNRIARVVGALFVAIADINARSPPVPFSTRLERRCEAGLRRCGTSPIKNGASQHSACNASWVWVATRQPGRCCIDCVEP